MALVLGVTGFCYATATCTAVTSRGADSPEAAARLVGSTNLRFTNPLATPNNYPGLPLGPTDFDLGDACFGTSIQRYVTCAGGVRPYSYISISTSAPANDLLTVLGNNSSAIFGASGYMFGSIAATSRIPFSFGVQATDSTGSSGHIKVQGTFHMNAMLCGAGMFKFAVDNINNGQVGMNYAGQIEAIGGIGTVTYSVLPNTLTLNGLPFGTNGALESLGVSLSADGTIFGRPLLAGQVSFKARAVDSQQRIAKDRSNSIADQVISFNIEQNLLTSTDYTTLSCSVRGDQTKVNKDTIKFTGIMNLQGNAAPSLRFQTFVFRLGNIVVKGQIDATGKLVTLVGNKLLRLPNGAIFKGKVDPKTGLISATLSKATVAQVLNNTSITDQGVTRLGFQLIVSNGVVAADTLEFLTRRIGDKLQMDYRMSKSGRPLGGAFQILSAVGKDGKTISGTRGDAWRVKFMIIPRFGVDTNPGLDALASINVRIGQRFVQKISSLQLTSTRNGSITMLKPAISTGVAKLKIDTRKFIGEVQTFPLDTLQTFISPAADVAPPPAKNPTFPNAGVTPGSFTNTDFDLGIDMNRTGNNASFIGEYGRFIIGVPGKKVWVDVISAADRRPQAPASPPPAPSH
jgi:hypothetical protein